ncbi:hypothetical protein QYZ87_01250 [Porphyromonadaceae bacterium W3.11]|nr:hypothetical protein [Porphyromonadaceae bacterium W3.11]
MITIYNAQGTKIIDVANLEGSYCDRSIMGGSTLQLVVKSDKPIDIPLNSYVEYEARRYTLLYPASIKKQHSKEFDYTLLFHGEEELLASCLIKDISGGVPYRVKFAITAKPIDYIRCIVDSLNEHYGGGWSVGNVIEATEQTLAFSHEYCLGAISRVAEVFNTEFSVDNKTVSLGKVSIMEDNPLPMSYGNGKGFRPGTGRHNDGKKSAIGKLYVEGGTRNIDYSSYGAQVLLLPKSATLQYNGRTYHTDAHGMYITCDQAVGTAEDSYDGSAVYPMREGTVSEVIEEADGYDFTDTSIPESLNFNDYRIKGEKAVVVFQTGALTGREFALVQTKDKLTGYIHSERKFKLVSEEQDGFMMPGGNFVPKSGDKYAIFNITLPAEYLSNASQRLFEEAVRYFDTVINPPYIFSGEVDPIWAKKEWLRIGGYMQPGGHLLFSDPQYHPEGSVIRVTGVRTLLDKPYAPQLTLSNAPAALSVSNALSKLEADKVIAERERRAQQRSQRQDYQQALEFIGMVEKAIEGLEGFTARIKPSVVETMAILMGSQATQFSFVQAINSMEAAPFVVNYDPSTKRVVISKGIIRHQTIGISDLTANRPATDYRYWSIPEYISPALTDDFASYYIYAKVVKDGQTGNYLLSADPIDFESDPLSYHLLIGTLSSIVDGDRAYNKLYGYSLLSPGQMVLNSISSSNSAMTINLETGEIYSDSISFKRPDTGAKENVGDAIAEQEAKVDEEQRAREEAIRIEREARLKAEEEARQARVELEELLQSLKDSTTSDTSTLTELINKVNLTLDNLQEQVDGEVSNWFYPGSPSTTKLPESEWITDAIRTRHIGDTYTSTDTSGQYMGKSWRYTTNFTWVEIADTLISQALAMASKAKTVADGKSTTFLVKPTKYEEGDTWVMESSQVVNGISYEAGTMLFAKQGSSVFIESHWVDKVRYIGATQLRESEAASKAAWEAYANAQAKLAEEQAIANADGKITAEEQARIDAVKKAVETAKAYALAQDELLKKQQEAYADGVLTEAEKRAIAVAQAKANLAETNAKAYADGVVTEAEKKAIAEAKSAYEKALSEAKSYTDLKASVEVIDANTKRFKNVAGYSKNEYLTGYMVITSPIQPRRMTRTIIDGFNYVGSNIGIGSFELDISAYIVNATGWNTLSFVQRGSVNIPKVQVARTAADITGALVFIIGLANTKWGYPKVAVRDSIVGYSTPPDSYKDGWSITVTDDISMYHTITEVPGTNLESELKGAVKATTDLKTYTDGAFADGIISKAEAISIEKLKNGVNEAWSRAFGEYSKVFANPALVGTSKTTLENTKISLAGAKDALLSAITTAIADGKSTPAEKSAVDKAYADFNTKLQAFQSALKDAEKAISDRIGAIVDTRDTNQPPNWYRKNYRYTTVKEFKFQGVIEIPKVWRDGSYCTLETTVNWSNSSGGRVTQKATLNSGQELYRVGSADDSAWGEWSNLKAEVQEINAGLSNANTLIETLETITKQLKEGKLDASKFDDIRYLTDALQHGETTIAGGLILTKSILMSNVSGGITTAISGYNEGGGVAFEAGIKNYKQENHTSRVVINHDGTARFGDMYVNTEDEDVVKFIDQSSGKNHEYLKFGGTAPSESYMNDQSTVIKEFPMPSVRAENKSGEFLIGKEYESVESNREIRHEFELTATAVAVAIRENLNSGGLSIMSARSAYELGSDRGDRIINYLPAWANSTAHVEVKVYNKSGVVVWSDTSTKVTASAHAKGGSVSYTEILPLEDIQDVQTQTKKVYMRIPANVMVKGYKWRVYLVVNGSASDGGSSYRAYTNAGKEFVPYDLSKPFVALAKDRVAFFFGRQRQILFNYLSNWVVKIVGDVLVQGVIKANAIEADEWKGSGAVLAGAMFDENGKELKGFGKYKNRSGQSYGSTVYSYNSKLYTVYHSIPHSRYVPVVQVSGETGNNGGWSLTTRVYSVSAYSFTVGIITNGDNKTRNGLSYVAYQAD